MSHDAAPALTLDELRHARQLEILARVANRGDTNDTHNIADTTDDGALEVGRVDGLPWTAAQLAATRPGDPHVALTIESGLTATVHRLEADGRRWTLKRARPEARVHNLDGRTSFLNEVQRRIDFERLKREPGGEARWRGVVDTRWASLRHGVILSPWIEGAPVAADEWDERRIAQVLDTLCAMWLEGLFDWDPSPGNLLDDGAQVRLFDFGYCYRFDPRRQFNSAGHGDDVPMFHPVERFETRTYCAVLLGLEQRDGAASALGAFRTAKSIALETMRGLRAAVASRGADARVIAWLDAITAPWALALAPGGDLDTLYLAENWRSHAMDLDDDLRGRSCTPMTLRRADWLLEAIDHHHAALVAAGALFHGDEGLAPAALRRRYEQRRAEATRFQLGATG